MKLTETQKALRIAKTEIAHLHRALEDVAESKDDDADDLRREALYALSQHCPRFEQEAEELRAGIEKLIEEDGELVRELVAFDADELAVKASSLRELLDRVDARDSLAFVEKRKKKARK